MNWRRIHSSAMASYDELDVILVAFGPDKSFVGFKFLRCALFLTYCVYTHVKHTTILAVQFDMSRQTNTKPIDRPQQNLQSIPPELRMMIFEHVLVHAGSINISGLPHNADSAPGHQTVECFRALSVLCKQMHREAKSIFFPRNTFCLQANGTLPAIPIRYVESMRNIELYRSLIGKTFVLKIHCLQHGRVKTSVEVLELTKGSSKERTSQTKSQIETTVISRLTQGAEVAARMIRRSVEDGKGMGMAVMQGIATQMNQQWIIAI